MPSNKQVGRDRVWRVFSNLVSHASKDELLVWVSDLTQETETGLDRRTIRTARILLEEQGLLVDMQRKETYGAKVFQVVIPKFQDAVQVHSRRDTPPPKQDASRRASRRASGRASGRDTPPQTEQNLNKTQLLFELVVKRQLEHETWRTHRDPEAFKKKHAAEYLPVCEKALRHFPGGHSDPDVVHWVLGDLFAKTNPDYKLSPSLLQILTNRYGLPGGGQISKEPELTPEQSALLARQVLEQFRQQREQNKQN